jgi:imidazolonepropionase-like amidohydrolase
MTDHKATSAGVSVMRAARLFDGEQFIATPLVQVADGIVIAVGDQVPSELPADDLGDVTLMPGIVDCHQHLVFNGDGTLEAQVADQSDQQLARRAWEAARRALLGGITTVRDLGDRNFVTLPLRGDPELPTLLCAGPPITAMGGHCSYLQGECTGQDSLRHAVQDRVDRGCDVVKIMVTGGFLTPTMPAWKSQFSAQDLKLVTELAHAAGLPVAAHCHGEEGIRHAIDAGVDTIEHCSFMNEPLVPDPDPQLIDDLATSGIALSATFGRCADAPPPPGHFGEVTLPLIRDAIRRVLELGGTVVVGSDAGINLHKPHDIAPQAIHDLMGIGMNPTDALAALTSGGADALGLPLKGRLRAGADADIITIDGDPRDDPCAATRIVDVWRAGTPVDRSAALN